MATRAAGLVDVLGAADGFTRRRRGEERGRTKGRQPGNARGHYVVLVGDLWDLVVDTDRLAPTEIADRVALSTAQT